MAKASKKLPFQSETINLSALCDLAGIHYMKVYRRKTGFHKSDLSLDDRTKLANALVKDLKPFAENLGYELAIHPKD